MYLLNRAMVVSDRQHTGRISALKFEMTAPKPSPCGPSGGKIGISMANARIATMPIRKSGVA